MRFGIARSAARLGRSSAIVGGPRGRIDAIQALLNSSVSPFSADLAIEESTCRVHLRDASFEMAMQFHDDQRVVL